MISPALPPSGPETTRSGAEPLRAPARIATAEDGLGVGDGMTAEDRDLVSRARVVTAVARVEAVMAARVRARGDPDAAAERNAAEGAGERTPPEEAPPADMPASAEVRMAVSAYSGRTPAPAGGNRRDTSRIA